MAGKAILEFARTWAISGLLVAACTQAPADPATTTATADSKDDTAADALGTDDAVPWTADALSDGDATAVETTTELAPETPASKCATADDCPANLPACLPGAGVCVACRWPGHCPHAGSRCIANQCVAPVACTSSKQCTSANAVCDTKAGFCVDCADTADCEKGLQCVFGQCLPKAPACTTSKECAALGLVCGGAAGCVDCTADGDCGAKEFCNQSQCVPDICLAGSATCTDDNGLGTCGANGGTYAKTTCPANHKCQASSCKPVVCAAGQAFCEGETLRQCGPLGVESTVVQDCTATSQVCHQGACVAQLCKPAATECQAGKLATCDAKGLNWLAADCPAQSVCNKGKCDTVVCSANAKSCSGNQLMQCDALGVGLVQLQDCAATAKVCDDGPTSDGGSCMTPVCKPAATQCVGKLLATCNAKGLAWINADCAASEICEAGACKPVVCTPNALSCKDGKASQCNTSGTGYAAQQDCAATKQLCVDGKCASQVCAASTTQCQAGKLATCAADGMAWVAKDCPASTACDQGACKAQVCTPNAKTCNGNKVSVCDALGLSSSPGPDCAASQQVCANGACVKSGCWPAGVVQCVNGQLGTCKADASGWDLKACDDGNPCTTDGCDAASNTCKPTGAKSCDDNNKCTKDSCNPVTGGCMTEALQSACDDGNGCTVGETCASGTCAPPGGWALSTAAGAEFFNAVTDGPAKSAQFAGLAGLVVGADGSVWLTDSSRIRKLDKAGNVSTVVGAAGVGFVNGAPGVAKFNGPEGMARDAAGNLYVADTANHAIRKVAPDGFVTTYAGGTKGFVDGDLKAAQFYVPTDVALDAKTGTLYIVDSANHRVRAIKPGGQVVTVCGSGTAGYGDGACSSAQFNGPQRLAILPNGGLVVGDSGSFRLRLVADGQVTTLAGSGAGGYADGAATSAKFAAFMGLLVGPSGEVYVSEGVRVRKVAGGQVSTVAGGGSGKNPGPATEFSLNGPRGLAYGPNLRVYLADKHAVRALDPTGGVQCNDLSACTVDACDPKTSGCVFAPLPNGAACDDGTLCTATSACDAKGQCGGVSKNCADGNPCTSDDCDPLSGACDNHPVSAPCNDNDACTLSDQCIDGVCVVDQATLNTVAGSAKSGFADGQGASAGFNAVMGVAMGPAASAYVADVNNHIVRKVTPAGITTTLAGQATKKGYADGDAAQALFDTPSDVAVDAQGRLVIAEQMGHRIRLFDPATKQVTTVAGAGTAGYADGAASSAQFNQPFAVAVAANGDIFVADRGNKRIRKVVAGQVSTVAGSGGAGKQDGAVSSATFSAGLSGMAIGPDGALYVVDTQNHAVRRIANGEVSTWVGAAGVGFQDGSLSMAKINYPQDVAFDATGAGWIADTVNYRVRRVVNGVVQTEMGNGTASMVDGQGLSGSLLSMTAIAVGAGTTAWIGDSHALRKLVLGKVSCDDGKPCTADACNKATGQCSNAAIADGGGCSGTKCMSGETCKAGVCGGGAPMVCDDKSSCTNDSCDGATGKCVFAHNGTCCIPDVVDLKFDDVKPTGFVFSNSAGPTKGWQVWSASPKAMSGSGVLYYGDPLKQNFDFGASNGTAKLTVNLAKAGNVTISFEYFFDGEAGKAGGFDDWDLKANGSVVYNKSSSGFTAKKWIAVSVVKALLSGPATLEWSFNTKDQSLNTGFGLAIDNFKVTQPCN